MDGPLEFIGLDIGEKFVGVARGNSIAKLAEPLATWPATEALKELAEQKVDGVVVGLPRGLNGQETEQTKMTRQWVEQAKQVAKASFYWQDEAMTTQAAQQFPAGSQSEHAKAAAVILQDFLNNKVDDRMVA